MLPITRNGQIFSYVLISIVLVVILSSYSAQGARPRKSCPPLAPSKGMVLSCFKRLTNSNIRNRRQNSNFSPASSSSSALIASSLNLSSKEKLRFSTTHSNDNCTSPSYLPGTVAQYKCLPYFTTKENTDTGGYVKCSRMGTWRHKNHFNNFSCHLRADGWINKLIDENRVVIFSKSFCIYCTRVKELFKLLGVSYLAIEIDHYDKGRQSMIREALFKKSGMKTWPNIYVNRNHLGGFDKAVYGYHDGTLQRLLNFHHRYHQNQN